MLIFYLNLNNMEKQQSQENSSEENQLNENKETDAQVEIKEDNKNISQNNIKLKQNIENKSEGCSCFICCYNWCYDFCNYSCDWFYLGGTNFWIRTLCCPFYCFIYRFFACFFDDRYGREPYYENLLFLDNVLFGIASIIDLVFLIIYKGDLNMGFFVVRIISDSFGILLLWFSFASWDEEALDNDDMPSVFMLLTIVNTIITCLLDFVSWIIFLSIDFKLNTTLHASLYFHFIVPIIMMILFKIFY